jgi:hypothetical protein
MEAKRGRPQSEKNKKLMHEQELIKIELKRVEDMLANPPSHINQLPVCALTAGLINSLKTHREELLNDYRHRPLVPPDLIFALNDMVVSPEHIEKYKLYFNAPKKGAEAKQKKGWEKTKILLEHNRHLLDAVKSGRLSASDAARIIRSKWFKSSTEDDAGELDRGIKGMKKKSESQLRKDIRCYLQREFK